MVDLERRATSLDVTAAERARLEVDVHEGIIATILTVHQEPCPVHDWHGTASLLDPVLPQKHQHHELRAKQCTTAGAAGFPAFVGFGADAIRKGQVEDEQAHADASKRYAEELALLALRRDLARRILSNDPTAFEEALTTLDPLAEISDLSVKARFVVHDASLVECVLTVNGTAIIPSDAKTLTATAKLSVKPMAKGRFHEIFQDYVCGCALRAAREVFGLLPIDMVLTTVSVDVRDASGRGGPRPVLSVIIPRRDLHDRDIEHADPSDAMERFLRRGDVKASRRTGEFAAISPLTPSDVPRSARVPTTLAATQAAVRDLRAEIGALADSLTRREP